MPDDPRDTSTTEDSTPKEPASQSSWAARRSLPPVEGVPSGPGPAPDEGASRPRSIFSRFRRGRMTPEDLQTRLMFGEEQLAESEVHDAPPLEPARVPPRRPAADDDAAASSSPPAGPPAAPASPSPHAGTRPTPPIEAILPAEMVEPFEPSPPPEPAVVPALTPPPPVTPWTAGPPSSAASPDVSPAAEPDGVAEEQPEPATSALPSVTPWTAAPPSPASLPEASTAAPAEVAKAPQEQTAEAPAQPVETPPAGPVPTPLVTTSRFEVFDEVAHPTAPAVAQTVATPAATADEAERPSRSWPAFRLIPVPVNPYVLLLSALASTVMLAYLLVEPSPRGYLILGAAIVAAGLDGTLRATWRVTYAGRETTAALFMPAIFVLAVPPLIEHNVRGLGVLPAGLAAGLAFFAIVAAQVGSARPGAPYYPWARTVSMAGAYAAGFAFFSLTYVYDLGVTAAAFATALVALMLAIEVLREGEIDATETAGYAAAAGVAVGQWRLALHYLPVDGYLAGLAVLLGFLLVTGLLQAYITRSLDRRTTFDHAVVALAGAALVVGARVAGLA